MTLNTYQHQFNSILENDNNAAPYDSYEYLNYVKLNASRIRRWNKIGHLNAELVEEIKNINEPQNWLLITEPWCGDAANTQAFISRLAELNTLISLSIKNRDSEGSEIEDYLTNGTKSIPKLVVRNSEGKDIFVWGPRPKEAQELFLDLRKNENLTSEERSIALQNWYNKDKGQSFQKELLDLYRLARIHA